MRTPTDYSNLKRIVLPDMWTFQATSQALRMQHLAKPRIHQECSIKLIEQEKKVLSWEAASIDWTALLLPKFTKEGHDGFENVMFLHGETIEGDTLVPGTKSCWIKHTAASNHDELATQARVSWESGILFTAEARGADGTCIQPGLRSAQIGALHAVAAHWTVSTKPALVVMPTGTGKTEVMLACMVMSRPVRLLVVVPSDALRLQTYDKFSRLGILQAAGIVAAAAMCPVTGMLTSTPKTEEELTEIKKCNVVVTTIAAIQKVDPALLKRMLELFDAVFFDEAHHLPAISWHRIHALVEEKRVLQFTATPFRLDGQRIPGRIIYNFPLRTAQAQGYFRKINFREVFEPDPDTGDGKLAEEAVKQLRADHAAGFDHLLLARADTTDRAEHLFETHYKQHADLTPIVIHSKAPGYKQRLQDIKAGKHKIIVCVDMFGEGFDLPTLKIAALHDPHKSLAITLQFTGRFTRDAKGIGEATLVANTAEPKVSDAIEELFAEDSDWNALIPELSAKAIQSQQDFSDFLERMDNKLDAEDDVFALNVLQPTISTVMYRVSAFSPTKFKGALKSGVVLEREWFSKDKDMVIFITRTRTPIDWATIKETTDVTWDLFILAHDVKQKLLFIHSSQKGSLHGELAEAVSGESATLLDGDKMFRAFSGISRLTFHNAGLYNKNSKLRFRMYAGLDIVEAIDPTKQANSTKSNLFGDGYENGEYVRVGVSHKGRVWSMRSGSVPDWRNWCEQVGAKILDNKIPHDEYLKHTLIPKEIKQLPPEPPFAIALPVQWYLPVAEKMRLLENSKKRSVHDLEIKGFSKTTETTLNIDFGFDDKTISTFQLTWGPEEGKFKVKQTTGAEITIQESRGTRPLAEYLTENPPSAYLNNGSEIIGGKLLEAPNAISYVFDVSAIEARDWQNVDIQIESKWSAGQMRTNSIQSRMLDDLKKSANQIVFDDDDSGEAADIVEIVETKDKVLFRLYHCKFSGGRQAGARVKDPAEVCAQAVRSIRWTTNPKGLIEHLRLRERDYKNSRPTRFEKGGLKNLTNLKRRLRKLKQDFEICIVQPGISKQLCTPEISTILGSANNFVLSMTGKPLRVISSA